MIRLAVIGAGSRASHMLATMHKLDADVQAVAVADPNAESARQALAKIGRAGR